MENEQNNILNAESDSNSSENLHKDRNATSQAEVNQQILRHEMSEIKILLATRTQQTRKERLGELKSCPLERVVG